MGGVKRGLLVPGLTVIDEKDAMLERQPWFVEFEPPAQVAGGATATVDFIQPWRDFVCTHIGCTSETVGFPAAPGRFKVTIQDVGAQRTFQPAAFDVTALIGNNMGASDNPAFELHVPWLFLEKTTIRVQLQNRNLAIPCLPTFLLAGYLTNWEREANTAMTLQQLQLAAMERQAGVQRPRQ